MHGNDGKDGTRCPGVPAVPMLHSPAHTAPLSTPLSTPHRAPPRAGRPPRTISRPHDSPPHRRRPATTASTSALHLTRRKETEMITATIPSPRASSPGATPTLARGLPALRAARNDAEGNGKTNNNLHTRTHTRTAALKPPLHPIPTARLHRRKPACFQPRDRSLRPRHRLQGCGIDCGSPCGTCAWEPPSPSGTLHIVERVRDCEGTFAVASR
jgi:hypothetical protein